MMRRLILALALLMAACDSGEGPAGQVAPAIDMAGLELPRLDGGAPEGLEAYRGKVVVMNIWATWCGPCRAEMPALQALSKRLDPAKFAVLGVSVDKDPMLVREYLRQQGLTFPRHIDLGGRMLYARFGSDTYPETFVIGPKGDVVWHAVGLRDWDDAGVVRWLEGLAS